MLAQVEVRVEFPGGMAGVKGRKNHALPVTRYQRQLRLDGRCQLFSGNRAIEDERAPDRDDISGFSM